MDENFTPNSEEIFTVTVKGKDIPECRFNAWTALEIALGEVFEIEKHKWRLALMSHGIGSTEDDSGDTIQFVQCQATWKYDKDSEGGKPVEEFAPEPSDPDRVTT